MLISVVIPIYNAAGYLPRVLPALAAQDWTDAEFILVDNNSTDSTPELLQEFTAAHPELAVRIITELQQGRSAARNRGIAEAQGEWLVFTDSDCVPAPDWLAELAAEMQAAPPELGALAGNIRPFPDNGCIPRFLGLFTLQPVPNPQVYDRFELISGGFPTANLSVRRQLAESIGGFDAEVMHGEDYDFCIRIYAAGCKLKTVPKAVVQHIHRLTLRQFRLQGYDYGYGHALALSRLPEPLRVFCAPGIRRIRHGGRSRWWIDLNQADKKLLGCVLCGLAWTPMWLLLPLYLCLRAYKIKRLAHRKNILIRFHELPLMLALLMYKSAALGWGRIAGACRYRVLCL